MSLSRKSLKAMGLTDEQVDSIVEMHTETVDALKEQRDTYKADADKYAAAKAELDGLKAKGDDGFKEKYEKVNKAFEDFKANLTAKETAAAKDAAVKKYLESKGIMGTNLSIAMRGLTAETSAVELDGEKIKDTSALDALIAGDFKGLVGKVSENGQRVQTPPNNLQQSALDDMSDEEYYAAISKK